MRLPFNKLANYCPLALLGCLVVCAGVSRAASSRPLSQANFERILETGSGWERITALTDKQAQELSHYRGITISAEFVARFEAPELNNQSASLEHDDINDSNEVDRQTRISASALESLRGARATLPLLSLRKLSARQAESLSRFQGHVILLWALESLREPQARSLAQFRGDWSYAELDLRELGELPAGAARELARFPGDRLNLDGLKLIGDSVAQALKESRCEELSLNGLQRLTLNQASALGAFAGERLFLNGLSALTTLQARALAGFAGAELSLSGITITDDAVMSELSSFRGRSLDLSGLRYLSEGQAGSLATYAGDELRLSGLRALSDSQAGALGKAQSQSLYLDGLTWLNARQTALLADYSGSTLSLGSLNQRDISGLQAYPGDNLYLTGLTELNSRKVKAILACRARMVWLTVERIVSDRSFAALRQSDSIGLVLSAVKTLRRVPLQLLMTWRGGLDFKSVTELDELFLPALSAWEGSALHLDGARELQPGQAKALSGFACAELSLRGLRALTDADIDYLIQYGGRELDVSDWSRRAQRSYFQKQFARKNRE